MDEEQEVEQVAQEVEQEVTLPPQEDNLKKAGHALAEMRRENQRLRQELERASAPPQVEEPDEYADPESFLTVKQAEKLAEKKARKMIDQELRVRDARTDEQLFLARNPGCEEVIKKYAPSMIQDNAAMAQIFSDLQHDPNGLKKAYEIVKQSWRYQQDHAVESDKAKKILKNASQPVSGNAATGTLKSKIDSFTAGLSSAEIWAKSQEYVKAGGR